jgi:hypothetical protein
MYFVIDFISSFSALYNGVYESKSVKDISEMKDVYVDISGSHG